MCAMTREECEGQTLLYFVKKNYCRLITYKRIFVIPMKGTSMIVGKRYIKETLVVTPLEIKDTVSV